MFPAREQNTNLFKGAYHIMWQEQHPKKEV